MVLDLTHQGGATGDPIDLLTRWPTLDLAGKRTRLQRTFRMLPGGHVALTDALTARASDAARAAAGLWRRDPTVWSADHAVQQAIAGRLGWLSSPALMADALPRLESFASAIRADGFSDVVLLGMGGSSLAPEVLRSVLGSAPGWPRLHVLDSTDPAAVRAVATPPAQTMYLLASKSGSTIEPNSLAAHFKQVLSGRVPRWNDHFVAITDEGTDLARRARDEQFRAVFINPSDIGGRYSALSFFGLVPAALMGQDVASLVGWALAMLSTCVPGPDGLAGAPAAALGLAMGSGVLAGCDKLTLLLPETLEPFGLWVEQLVAESTGKQRTGVVPVAGEPVGVPANYGADRLFVNVCLNGVAEESRDTGADRLKAAGAPMAEIDWLEPAALGAEFVRWEIATAVASALIGVNPFDEPNVRQAKEATSVLLDRYLTTGGLGTSDADETTDDHVSLTLTPGARSALGGRAPDALLTLIKPSDYFGLLVFLGPDPDLSAPLRRLRAMVRDRTGAATTFGDGPRYLHSTGQLHKGGPNTGVYLLISAAPSTDLPIPGQPYSFGTLEHAQALGDFQSLGAEGRRALHVHLPAPDPRLVEQIVKRLLDQLPPTSRQAG